MYEQIKRLADDALALQNKDRMEAALRQISALAGAKAGDTVQITGIENTETGESAVLDVKVKPAKKGDAQ